MDDPHHPGFAPTRHDGEQLHSKINAANNRPAASTLSERIELLDGETRSCWRRVDELEDEEDSLNHRLTRLENIVRGERMEILTLEQACKAAEMTMLRAQEDAADLDARSDYLESMVQVVVEDDACTVAADDHQTSSPNGGGIGDASSRPKGSAALLAVLSKIPRHEEKRQHLMSMLQEKENRARREVAEAARSAAELRRSAKKKAAERLPLERETSRLREELEEMTGENEIKARTVRARQVGEGLQRRLQHANNKLTSVRDALAQGPARHLEEEEQRTLELMQGIAEAKTRLRSCDATNPRSSSAPGCTNRGGRLALSSGPRPQTQSSLATGGRKGQRHDHSQRSSSRKEAWDGWT